MFNITPEEGVFGDWSTFPCDHCNPASMLSLHKYLPVFLLITAIHLRIKLIPSGKKKAINSVYLTLPFILKEPLTPQPSLVREKSALGYTAPRRDLGGGGGGEMWGESGCFVLQLKEVSFKLTARPSSHLKTQGIK